MSSLLGLLFLRATRIRIKGLRLLSSNVRLRLPRMCIFIISFLLGRNRLRKLSASSIFVRSRTWVVNVFGRKGDLDDIYKIVIIVEFECSRMKTGSLDNPSARNIDPSKANESLHSCPAIRILLATNLNKKLITNNHQMSTLFEVF